MKVFQESKVKSIRWERGVKDIKKLLIGLLIGRRNRYFGLVRIRGKVYRVDIQPYVSVEEEIRRAKIHWYADKRKVRNLSQQKSKDGVEAVESRISVVNTLRTAFKIVMVLEEEKIPYGMFEEVIESVKSIIAFTPIKHNPSDENHFSFPK